MKTIELSITILYMIVLVAIGFYSWKKSKDSVEEYWVAGRSVSTFVNSWAFVASLASGGTILAMAGTGFKLGISYAAALTGGAVTGFVIASILVAGPMRNLGKFTVTDFLTSRFDSKAIKIIVPIIIITTSLAYIIAQLKGAGLVATYVLGISYEQGLIITTLAFVFYVSFGGMNAITLTDVLQGILMTLVVIVLGGSILINFESLPSAITQATTLFPSIGKAGESVPISSYIGGFLIWATAIAVTPHIIMRVYTAKNIRSAKMSLNFSMIIYAIIMLIIFLVILPAAAFLPSQEKPDMFFLLLADQYFGPIMRGIVVAGIMAAVMSTTDALLLAASSAVAHDLYAKLINPNASQKKKVRVATITNWVIGGIALLFALNPPQLLVLLYTTAIGLLASSLFFPMVLTIWWKRTNSQGALYGILGGAISYLTLFFMFEMPTSTEILISLPFSLLVTVGVSLITEKPSMEQIKEMEILHSAEM